MVVEKKILKLENFWIFNFIFFRNRKRNWIGFREEIRDNYGKGLGLFVWFEGKERKISF